MEVKTIIIPVNEAVIESYSGKIRSGKTYTATRDAVEDLKNGNVVYTSWKIAWEGYDERKSKWNLWKASHGLKKEFKYFPKENWHYLPLPGTPDAIKHGHEYYAPYTNFQDKLFSLTDCIVYLDEGQGVMNSYERTNISEEKQNGILFTGHFNRTIKIISQRPIQIHPILRANVSRFWIIEKNEGWFSTSFKKSEYQETDSNSLPDRNKPPESEEEYSFDKKIGAMYNSKYMRGDVEESQSNGAVIYEITKKEAKEMLKKK